jgi:acetyl-CoA carboxylase carboxyl transferase subunit alpha
VLLKDILRVEAFHASSLTMVKENDKVEAQRKRPTFPKQRFVRLICDKFIELRQGPSLMENHELAGGVASIGPYSAVVLIHAKSSRPRAASCIPATDGKEMGGYKKARHLMQLAHKFRQPVIVFNASTARRLDEENVGPCGSYGLIQHMFTQWQLEVPMVLVVLGRTCSGNILSSWLPNKILACEEAHFSMNLSDEEKSCRVRAQARELLRLGVIDGIFPNPLGGTSGFQAIKYNYLKNALLEVLGQASRISPAELLIQRAGKNEAIKSFVSKHCGQRMRIGEEL